MRVALRAANATPPGKSERGGETFKRWESRPPPGGTQPYSAAHLVHNQISPDSFYVSAACARLKNTAPPLTGDWGPKKPKGKRKPAPFLVYAALNFST